MVSAVPAAVVGMLWTKSPLRARFIVAFCVTLRENDRLPFVAVRFVVTEISLAIMSPLDEVQFRRRDALTAPHPIESPRQRHPHPIRGRQRVPPRREEGDVSYR